MDRRLLLALSIFLPGCTAVKVINTSPPADRCVQLGVVSAAAQDEPAVLRILEKDVARLGGNVLFLIVDTGAEPETADQEVESGITKYGMAYRCNLMGLE
jgi:hypothetical protein